MLLCYKINNWLKIFINQLLINFEKEEFILDLEDSIWGADLADMQVISMFNIGFRFSLYIIDNFGKYTWAVPLKDIKGVIIVNAFKKNIRWFQKKTK